MVIGPTVNENIVRARMVGIGNDPGKNLYRVADRGVGFEEENFLIFQSAVRVLSGRW